MKIVYSRWEMFIILYVTMFIIILIIILLSLNGLLYKFVTKKLRFKMIFHIVCTISCLLAIYNVIFIPLPTSDENKRKSFLSENYTSKKPIYEYKIKNFDVYENTIPTMNPIPESHPQGECKGFAILEKLVFLNEVSKLQDVSKNKMNLNGISKKLDSYENDFTKNQLGYQNENVKKILDTTGFIQTNAESIYKPIIIQYPSRNIDNILEKYSGYIKNKADQLSTKNKPNFNAKSKLDISDLTHRIENNEPLVIGFTKKVKEQPEGHAVLVYKYEQLSNSEYKFYVADSNYPFLAENKDKHLEMYYYMVFKKIDGRWEFKYSNYRPELSAISINEQFDSFSQDVNLLIY